MRKALLHLGLSRCSNRVAGVEALKVWEQHRNRIDLFSRRTMVMPRPDVTGKDLAERFLKEKSKIECDLHQRLQRRIGRQGFSIGGRCSIFSPNHSADKLAQTVREKLMQ